MLRYPEYKDSGIEWIGEVPIHWEVGKLKWKISENAGGIWGDDIRDGHQGTIVVRSTEITIDGAWDMSNPMLRMIPTHDFQKYSLIEGDIVITKSSGSEKHIGKSAVVNDEVAHLSCCYSNFVQRIRLKDFLPCLYHYILNSYIVREQYRFLTQSTTGLGNLNTTSIDDIILPYIPLSNQQVILNYLDQKTIQIDSLIEKLEQKIELLKEYRTSLISQCVTKGLDPDVEMKDSGIEWIGEIPDHWNLKRTKYVCAHISEKRKPVDGDIQISPENVESHTGRVLNYFSNYETEGQIFCTGDILFNKLRVYLNKVVLCQWSGLSMGEMIVLRPFGIENAYFFRMLGSQKFIENVDSLSEGVKMPRPPVEGITNTFLPIPSQKEQIRISKYLDKKTEQIDSLIEKIQGKIGLLKEYRQSLISNVVTGKVRVTESMG